MSSQTKIYNTVYGSPWRNCYWFARMLLSTDKYGAAGKNEKFMNMILSEVEPLLLLDSLSDNDKYKVCRDSLKYIVLPTNEAVRKIPSDDKHFSREYSTKILKSLSRQHVAKVLATWDTLGKRGCLNVERELIITEFTKLQAALKSLKLFPRNTIENNAVLTAFVQEFERRVCQKRKNRAGGSLEDVLIFLFEFYKFKSHPQPEHFQSDIEVDKWFKCRDGWLIGISCKRTLRERWKQVSSADSNILSRHKIKEIWHLITFDNDLSDDKIITLGPQRHVFYLNDDSDRFINASQHIGMKNYVRPLSQLIDNISHEQGGSKF